MFLVGPLLLASLAIASPASATRSPITWHINALGGSGSELLALACMSPDSCVAVGQEPSGLSDPGVAQIWNGSSWSPSTTPVVPNVGIVLDGVSCTSTFCLAVGFSQPENGTAHTLAEDWNGSTWSVVPTPNVGSFDNVLSGVSCYGPSGCTAVGYDVVDTAATTRSLVESWNGSTWSVESSPTVGSEGDDLNTIFCKSARRCIAAGWSDGSSSIQTLTETWSQGTWTVSPSPSPSTDNLLFSISCSSTRACTAVGYEGEDSSTYRTLIESWNGSTWVLDSSPNQGADDNGLYGVSCKSKGSCVAVGYSLAAGQAVGLVEYLRSGVWQVAGSSGSLLFGDACPLRDSCLAVGDQNVSITYGRGT
jgi:hypothetical protein